MPFKTLFNFFKNISKDLYKNDNPTYLSIFEQASVAIVPFEADRTNHTSNIINLNSNLRKKQSFKLAIERHWHDPIKLYEDILIGYDQNYFVELIDPAKRLLQIDPDPERATFLAGLIMLHNRHYESAASIYEYFFNHYGCSARLLYYYTKTMADPEKVQATLWRTIEMAPNFKAAVDVWLENIIQQHGKNNILNALQQIAALPDSWLAKNYIAAYYLKQKKVKVALKIYQALLKKYPQEVNLIALISHQLNESRQLTALFNVILPFYNPAVHGVWAGLNFLSAYYVVQDSKRALKLIKRMKPFVEQEHHDIKMDVYKLEKYFLQLLNANKLGFKVFSLLTLSIYTILFLSLLANTSSVKLLFFKILIYGTLSIPAAFSFSALINYINYRNSKNKPTFSYVMAYLAMLVLTIYGIGWFGH